MMSSRLSPCLVFFFLSASWLSLAFWLPCDFQSQLIEFHKNTYCDFDLNSITPDNFWTQFISRNRSSKTKKRIKEDTLGPSQPGFSHLQNTRFAFWVAFMEYGIVEVGVFFFFLRDFCLFGNQTFASTSASVRGQRGWTGHPEDQGQSPGQIPFHTAVLKRRLFERIYPFLFSGFFLFFCSLTWNRAQLENLGQWKKEHTLQQQSWGDLLLQGGWALL